MGANGIDGGDTRAVLDAVRRIVHALHESSRLAERRVGLSGAQLFVLQKLDEGPGASINDLATRTHTHQSSVSAVVARLVDRRLVHRARSGADARQVELNLTPAGRRLTDRAPDVAQARLVQAIESLTASRRHTLATSLTALASAVDRAGRTPTMFFEGTSRAGARSGPGEPTPSGRRRKERRDHV
jgi:DNA-binding MarR family transcriptional regulator